MNPDIKARWVAALRSGEYVQGEGSSCVSMNDLGKSFDEIATAIEESL